MLFLPNKFYYQGDKTMKKNYKKIISAMLLIAVIVTCGFIFGTYSTASSFVPPPAGFQLQDFENPTFPPAGWMVTNTSGYNWVRTMSCSGYGQGTSSAKADFFDYASGNFDLISAPIPVSSAGDSLAFDHAYATYSSENDQLIIYTSTNDGSAWVMLITLNGGVSGPLVTAPPSGNVFIPTSTQWATKRYALPAGTNKIKFTGVTAYGNNLYLDNIRIGAGYTIDVGANSVSEPKGAITPSTKTPKVSVRNYGSTVQSFQVTLTINPGAYSNTQSVSNLGAGQTQLVTFSNFTFPSNGSYTLKAYTSLATDLNRANDTISSSVIVTPAPRNVVLEYCTGTWCQWCPCGKQWAHELEIRYPNSIVLAYHGGSDPWINFNGNAIIGQLGMTGYPSGVMDRRGIIGWGSFFTDGEYRYATSPAATVNLVVTNQTYNTTSRELSVTLNATALATLTGQYKISYVITEDNLVYNQSGNGTCPGGPNYVHYWVVRNMVNGSTGENVNSGGTWTNGQTFTKSFTTTLNSAWVASNCKFQIFVYKDNNPLNMGEIQQGIKYEVPIVGVSNQNNGVPLQYELSQNYPNPFNPVTNVKFAVPKDGNVSFKIYDAVGRVIDVYLDGYVKAGFYNAEIDGSNLSSGIYFYTLSAKEFTETKKMVLVK